jgi:glycosyltransferase involved in cell wall biosynthesis
MTSLADDPAEVLVLLTPRALGGHEIALFGWLGDAVRSQGLRPRVVASGTALAQAAADAGLGPWLLRARHEAGAPAASPSRSELLALLRQWPPHKPLLLAPGVLHADAWLTAAAVALGRRVWLYVPMTHSARQLGYRAAVMKDALVAPWVRRVEAIVTLDRRLSRLLRANWSPRGPIWCLPNPPRPAPPDRPWPMPERQGRLRVAFVGRFDAHQKGLDWLIATLAERTPWTTRCQWRFQGSGPADAALRRLAKDLGGDQVVVNRHAPIDDALAVADVLLLASRFEGVPLVALEATVRGWPVVATREAGVADFLPSTSLFDFGDAVGLRRALHGLRHAPARQAAVEQARTALQALDWAGEYRDGLRRICRALRAPQGRGQWPRPAAVQ